MGDNFKSRVVTEARPLPQPGQIIYEYGGSFSQPENQWILLRINLTTGDEGTSFTPQNLIALKPFYPGCYSQKADNMVRILTPKEFFAAEVVYTTLVYKYWWQIEDG